MENLNSQNNRITVRVPFSVLEVIDRIVLNKVNDGEANATRSSVALELLKLGARIEKKKLENIESGSNSSGNRLEEQLSYIAHTIVRNGVLAERFLNIITEFNKIPNDFAIRIAQGIKLSDEEKKELKRLFINMDFKQKKP
ncbi:hypothetical protein [Streptococcus agalactiae]|jgi:hypothetical protein|uniref:hypothetical protein n=2 Tax=Streptococcus agalactiae TaxID=1311 RepID=UPI0002BA4CA3|nr:hypothetical protein [Streptococcus agalactiae]EPT57505.1 hypothetical protein SAG0051_11010 [Streptococcus agalactiae CCUG 19094]EPW26273.1 hypothetical protein SAG0068_00215 [Streptococcus agalactiae CCUG 44050]EPW31729.1 hypothetical protein SAG0071_01940 [Streptococcus agalactiae CCUG 44104]EPX23383.1 hypothetical protein SAG0212_10235 [Streptococcus agalactiae str. Gottschalk 2864]EPX23431.1 hypothetical protein SAG0210_10645 [Streptococcus agalactiae str. Gottschalk 13227]